MTFKEKRPKADFITGNEVLGIDLGTTNSVVGFYENMTRNIMICQNEQGYLTTPSVVFYDKNDPIIHVG